MTCPLNALIGVQILAGFEDELAQNNNQPTNQVAVVRTRVAVASKKSPLSISITRNKDKIRNSEGPLQFGGFLGIIYQMLILVSQRQIIRRLVSYPPPPAALF